MADVRSGSRSLAGVALALVLAVAGALAARPAHADTETGTISGTVRLPGGAPAAGVAVEAWDADSWYDGPGPTVTTAVDGTYELTLEPGNHFLRFVHPSGDYLWSVHGGRPDAPDDVIDATGTPLAAGETLTIDHDLLRAGSVRGTLTLPDDVDPTDLSVVVHHPRPAMGMSPRRPMQWGEVAADGTFVIPLRPGDWVVDLAHRDELVFTTHHEVTVEGVAATHLDVALPRSGLIAGVVQVPAGSPEQEVRVSAQTVDDDGWWSTARDVVVRAGEPYRMAGLRTGTYRISFSSTTPGSVLASSHWPGVSHVDLASDVHVVEGEHHPDAFDGQLVVGGAVTGRVDPALHFVADSTTVGLWRDTAPGPAVTWQRSDVAANVTADGTFRVEGVAAGRYRLGVVGLPGEDWEVFHPAARSVEAAQDIEVSWGATTSGVDVGPPAPTPAKIRMRKAPTVKGKVRVGRVLRVTKGAWQPTSVQLKRRWFVKRGSKVVRVKKARGAAPRLRLRKAQRGAKVRVRVVVRAPGHEKYVFTSRWTRRIRG